MQRNQHKHMLTGLVQHVHQNTAKLNLCEGHRLFHGRGHAYPGLEHINVDWLPPVLLLTLFAEHDEQELQDCCRQLLAQFPACRSVQLQERQIASGPVRIICGENLQQLQISEAGLKYHVRLGRSRNIGLFPDMRNGRLWVRQHSNAKRVLNLFSYTCAFSVAAIAGNAQSVLNVDMSSQALGIGRDNHRLNKQALEKIRFEKLDIFKSFGRFKKRGPYDLLICDPPTFQKGSVDIARDYPKILKRLPEFMATGAELMLCLNAPDLNDDYLTQHMKRLAPNYQFIDKIAPPPVFKDAQDKGLKIMLFKDALPSTQALDKPVQDN